VHYFYLLGKDYLLVGRLVFTSPLKFIIQNGFGFLTGQKQATLSYYSDSELFRSAVTGKLLLFTLNQEN
jgi:hypothetical protein